MGLMHDGGPDRWALFPWFEEHGTDHVYPDDLADLRDLSPYGRVFRHYADDPPYAVLGYAGQKFRVRPDLVTPITSAHGAILDVGATVQVIADGSPARILEVAWHHEKQAPFYQLRVNGRKKSKRYWPDDIEPANS